MNKKILSIFALIMAISILGVSCAKDNSTTNPVIPPTPPIKADKALAILNGVTTAITTGGTSFDFTALQSTDIKQNGMNYEVTIKDTTASSGTVPHSTFKTAIEGAADEMVTASQTADTEISINKSQINIKLSEDKKKAVVTIPYTLKNSANSKGSFVITFELAKSGTTATFEPALEIALNGAGSSSNTPITLDASKTAAEEITFTVTGDDSGVTYAVTAAAGLNNSGDADATAMGANVNLSTTSEISTSNVSVKAGRTIEFKTEVMTALNTALAFDTDQKFGAIKVTITATKDGYETKPLVLFVKAEGPTE